MCVLCVLMIQCANNFLMVFIEEIIQKRGHQSKKAWENGDWTIQNDGSHRLKPSKITWQLIGLMDNFWLSYQDRGQNNGNWWCNHQNQQKSWKTLHIYGGWDQNQHGNHQKSIGKWRLNWLNHQKWETLRDHWDVTTKTIKDAGVLNHQNMGVLSVRSWMILSLIVSLRFSIDDFLIDI